MLRIFALLAVLIPLQTRAYNSAIYHLEGVKKDGVLYLQGRAISGALTSEEVAEGRRNGKYVVQNCDSRIGREITLFAQQGAVCLETSETGCVKWDTKPFCKPGQRPIFDIQNSEHVFCARETSPRFLATIHLPSFRALVFCELADGEVDPNQNQE